MTRSASTPTTAPGIHTRRRRRAPSAKESSPTLWFWRTILTRWRRTRSRTSRSFEQSWVVQRRIKPEFGLHKCGGGLRPIAPIGILARNRLGGLRPIAPIGILARNRLGGLRPIAPIGILARQVNPFTTETAATK